MTSRTVLVIGASGQVGRACAAAFEARGFTVVGTGHARAAGQALAVDLGVPGEVAGAIRSVRPRLCVLTAALPAVDRCEAEPALARAMNAGSAWEAAEACREVGARLIFLSSEYVFDGRAGPYAEADATNPLSVYGLTKLLGEQATLDGGPDNLVVRSTVVFSHAPGEMNFLMQLAARLGRGERMKVPVDQVSSPTYAPALGEALAAVAERASGLLHVAGPEVMDRFTLARRVAARLGLDAGLLEPVTTADLGQPAARPLQAGLKVERLAGFRIRLPDLEEALGLVVAARSAPRAGLNPS